MFDVLFPVLIPVIGAILAVALLAALASACYVKAPPTEAVVVTGLGHKEPKVVSGRGTFVIPVLQRADRINMRVMKLDVKTPDSGVKTIEGVPVWIDSVVMVQVYSQTSTVEEEEWKAAGCTSKKEYINMRQQAAISNFLGAKEEGFNAKVNDVLQGNLREIVAEMPVMDVLTKRKEFATRVIANAKPDLAKVGLEVVTFNIQNILDAVDSCGVRHGVVEAIGVAREMEVKKEAETARAQANRDIAVAQAEAEKDASEKKAEADKKIAEAQTSLALKKSELKAQADKAHADAEAAGQIQIQLNEKTRREAAADVEIAAQEKEISRAEKEAEVKQRKLDAEIRKQADADKYRAQMLAEATKYADIQKAEAEKRRRELAVEAELFEAQKKAEAIKVAAEAQLYEAMKKAEGIKAEGLAEAEAIRAKAIAEAEGIEKKAEAQAKMGEASKLEMKYNVLPQVAHEIASILTGVDHVTLYGTDTASKLLSDTTQGVAQFMEAMDKGSGTRPNVNALAGAMLGAKLAGNGSGNAVVESTVDEV